MTERERDLREWLTPKGTTRQRRRKSWRRRRRAFLRYGIPGYDHVQFTGWEPLRDPSWAGEAKLFRAWYCPQGVP